MAGKRKNTEQTFWNRVKKMPNGCWEFQSWEDGDGYRFFCYHGKDHRAHRLAYEFTHGPIPDKMVVMHSCDNPPCCNPAHLKVGTVDDNSKDMGKKGRGYRNYKLTEQQVLEIRNSSLPKRKLAKIYNVSEVTIYNIVNRKLWKHI